MAKRPDTLETTLIAIELLRRIPRSGKISAPELHRQLAEAGFERDLRSIQRLLKALAENDGFGIELDDRSKPYGYCWLPKAAGMTVANLSAHESMLLMMAREHMRYLLPVALTRSMEGYFSQAQQNLMAGEVARLEKQWPDKVRVIPTTQPLLPPKIKPEVFEVVSDALYANRWLKLDYANSAGKRVKANIMPLGLAQQAQVIYLVCRFDGFDDERSIALHRVLAIVPTTLGFERPKDFSLRKYDEDGRFSFGSGKRVKLSFRTTKANAFHLEETPLSTDQTITERKNGTVDVTATVVDSRLLETWLIGFGDAISHVKKVAVK